jgi:catechol 2,3-dioxygenase-like lactoylglutathione lyase family enzyme
VQAVFGVARLWVRALELVRGVRDVAVRRSLVGLAGSATAQGLVCVVQALANRSQALVAGIVERTLRLGTPERVLLGDELLDLVQDRLFVHAARIVSPMFDHVTIRVANREASERFYDTVLTELGIDRTYRTGTFSEWDDFSLTGADETTRVTRRLHIGFVAPSRDQADAFWRVGTEAGYGDDGPPGPRPEYREDYYGAFLLDPDGNSAEAVHHGALRREGVVDHLWIRVADVAAAKRFYEAIAPFAGFRLRTDTPERAQFAGTSGSFSLVRGEPTENLHMAFPCDDDAAIQRFHDAATSAGYRSNGPPGERPQYHPGYYAAYVLDPDGNNVEVVNHHRP